MPTVHEPFTHLSLYEALNNIPDGVTIATPDGKIAFSNTAADRMLGVAADTEGSPEDWTDHYGVFLPDRETAFPADRYPLVRALSGEHTRNVEMYIRNAAVTDGVLVSVSGQPLRDRAGTLVGALVVFRDVTELRETQRRLEETIEQMAQLQRTKEELTSFIVHDLKNPLTAIMATCQVMAMSEPADESQREDISAIEEAASRLHRLVLDLLDVQMAEDGALELDQEVVPLGELFKEVEQAARPRLAQTHQRIEDRLESGASTVLGDRPLLFRVLMNLVDNCVKYGPERGTIWVEGSAGAPGRVRLCVSDEGPGVPPELRERIFERYAQVERDLRRRSNESRGLGLQFCKVVMDAHGGRIWVEDREPVGASFCLELPAAVHQRH